MKQFGKWYGKLPMREDAKDFTLATQTKYKKGWRAALEWIHEYMVEQEPDTPYFDYVLLNKIEKELGDT